MGWPSCWDRDPSITILPWGFHGVWYLSSTRTPEVSLVEQQQFLYALLPSALASFSFFAFFPLFIAFLFFPSIHRSWDVNFLISASLHPCLEGRGHSVQGPGGSWVSSAAGLAAGTQLDALPCAWAWPQLQPKTSFRRCVCYPACNEILPKQTRFGLHLPGTNSHWSFPVFPMDKAGAAAGVLIFSNSHGFECENCLGCLLFAVRCRC